jgi:hypothetical protein
MKITYTDVKPLVEALKEAGRIAMLAILPVAIEQFSAGKFDWRVIASVAGLAVLKAVDKYIHLTGKLDDNAQMTKGLTQF